MMILLKNTLFRSTLVVALPLLVVACTAPHAYGQADERPFVMTWAVKSEGLVKIPVDDENGTYGATGEYTVDWGDGTVETISGTAEHRYAHAGNYAISITGNYTKIYLHGSIPNGSMSVEEYLGSTSTSIPRVGSSPNGLLSIDQWGDVKWTSMAYAFSGARNMVYNATDVPDLSLVTDMNHMFYFAKKFNGNLSSWNVSGVTDMSRMFYEATAFNGDVSGWNVSGVTDMSRMFYESDAFNQDVSGWDVSGVTDMSWMFSRAFVFNQDISSWNVSGVTDMSRMFANDIYFNQDISSWDVSGVTDMSYMFYGSYSFNHDISSWNVSGVTDMSHMFQFAYKFNRDISEWDVSNVTDMNHMFKYAETFNGNISSWNVSGVTDMSRMFEFAYKFNGNISSWNVSGVTDMSRMFQSAYKFNGDISGWDVSNVTDMSDMFDSATAFNQNLGRWYIVPEDTSIVDGDSSLVVTTISAQNAPLDSQNPVYAIGVGHDSSDFEMDHNVLKLKVTPVQSVKPTYTVSVTATGAFGANNHRLINITVAEYVPDTTPPNVSMIWRDSPSNAITNGTTLQFGIMFSESVQNVDAADFVLTGTGNASITHVSGSHDEYGVVASVTTDGTVTLELAANNDIEDIEDNGLIDTVPTTETDHTYTVDTTAPTVTSIERYSPTGQNTDSQTLEYQVTFSENVTGVNTGDFALSPDSPGASSIAGLAGSGSSYHVTISATQNGTYNLDLVSSGHGITDTPGNPLNDTSPTGEDQSYTVTILNVISNSMPSVDAGSNQTVQENSTVTLSGTASDADDDPLTYLWSHDSDLTIALSDAASLSASFTAPQVDSDTTITFTLAAYDETSNATDTTSVTITDSTPPVVADAPRSIGSVTLASTAPGVVEASWDAPAEEPGDYRIAWAKVGEGFRTWTDLTVNAFPTTTSHTITDLEEGAEYKVMVRARYDGGSGDWSDQYTVTVKASAQDTTDPTITLTGDNPYNVTTGTTYSDPGATCTDNTDANPTLTTASGVDAQTAGTYQVTYTCTDSSSNTATATRDVVVADAPDTIDPTITITGANPIRMTTGTAYSDPGATCTDNTDASPTLTTASGVDAQTAGTYQVTYTCTDSSNNTATATRDVVVADAPRSIGSVTLASTAPGVVEASWDAPAEEPGDYRIAWAKVGEGFRTWTDLTVNAFPTTTSHTITDLEEGAEYKVMVRARYDGGSGDWSDQYTVTVKAPAQDTTDPTITLTGDNPYNVTTGTTYSDPGATCTDNTDANPTLTTASGVDAQTAGTYQVTYTCTDSSNNTATATRDVVVADAPDTIDPTITITGANPIRVTTGTAYSDPGATCTDNTDASPTLTTASGVDAQTAGTYQVTYTCTDSSNNTATATRDVVVADAPDRTAPTVSSIERHIPTGQNTGSQTLVYQVTFSENVIGVDAGDFALSPDSPVAGGASGQFAQTREPAIPIPDRGTIQDAIAVGQSGTTTSVSVAVDITHTYIGDLVIDLIAPDGTTRTLHDRTGYETDDIDQTYAPDFGDVGIAGDWILRVRDSAGGDTGTLNGWALTINHGSTAGTANPVTSVSGSGDTYRVTVSATQDGTYNLDLVSSGHGIVDEAGNPLADTTPTGANHTYIVGTAVRAWHSR